MYILIEMVASPGDYIKHKHTEEIIHVTHVKDDGAVLYSVEELKFDRYYNYWEADEYFVLYKIASGYFLTSPITSIIEKRER
ncbi:hypothetical protein [Alkalihalobacterium elongatum]|uniref:hypothetical protein n=1 Tax=Alkalihalobacterium elongatum TaxID=2675466 RepID=UPI001C1F33BD|nr:hypothetical protein [Alkalihalobacterium elongatum]